MADDFETFRQAISSRYRIEGEIGRGGMATVYLAEDMRHRRQVAVKVLGPELARAIGPERFQREIETAARLTHPHIVPLHDSGSAAGLLYYVMPHVEGESLRVLMDRERQLPIPDAVRLAAQVARALDYAHTKGVVHRDIKPENVLLASGQAMLADFGIARAIERSAGERLTETGVTLGTPAYMSPEQTTGVQVDGRSDIYSLGCVLYEMVAGQPPFSGATAESVVHQHLAAPPRPVRDLRPSVPEPLARAIARALSKTPADRFRTGAAFAEALDAALATNADMARVVAEEQSSPARGTAADPSSTTFAMPRIGRRRRYLPALSVGVIVLLATGWLAWSKGWLPQRHPPRMDPNRRAWVLVADFDAPDTALAAAVRDLVSTALDQSTVVRTVPAAGIREALAAAGRPVSTRLDVELARELAYRRSVRAVITGRVARVGQSYALTVRVEDVDSVRVIATVTETAKDDDALIPAAERVGAILRRRLGEASGEVRAIRPMSLQNTPSFEAFRLYTIGNRIAELSGDGKSAAEMFRQATFLDPEFAWAWACLGVSKANGGDGDSGIVFLRRALQYPARLTAAQRYWFEGMIAAYQGDNPRSISLYRESLELADDPTVRNSLANRLSEAGRLEEALAMYRSVEQEEWMHGNALVRYNEWIELLNLGRVDEAALATAVLPPLFLKQAAAWNALVGRRWGLADSLGTRLLEDDTEDSFARGEGGLAAAGALAAIGAPSGARQRLDRVVFLDDADSKGPALYAEALLDLLYGPSGRPLQALAPADSGSEWQDYLALRYTLSGDSLRGRALLARLRQHAPGWDARLMLAIAEGLLDARAARYDRVVGQLGSTARTGLFESRLPSNGTTHMIRWQVATAWERLGRADSAAVYYELALETGGHVGSWTADAIALPFALQRLVVVNARMGRFAQAEAWWGRLRAEVTKPDEQFQQLLAQARAEIASAEAREGPARR